jgi:hypothetical protein
LGFGWHHAGLKRRLDAMKILLTQGGNDNSYMCRMLNLSTLTPDFVAAILDETLPSHLTVHELAISPPVLWDEQRERIGVTGPLGQEQANSVSG